MWTIFVILTFLLVFGVMYTIASDNPKPLLVLFIVWLLYTASFIIHGINS